jgi:hypothetical protein
MIAPLAQGQISSAIAMDIRPPLMPEDAQRMRFAIGVFYDANRLRSALTGFWQLGLTANEIWLAGQQQALDRARALLSGHADLNMLLDNAAVFGKRRDKARPSAAEGPIKPLLQNSVTPGKECFIESVLQGDMGMVLQDHVEKGGIISATKTHSPAVQDQCIRILLRTSLDKVYSQECISRLSRDMKARS